MIKIADLNPLSYPKYIQKFLIISYSFSFVLWILAWIVSYMVNIEIPVNNEIINSSNFNQIAVGLIASVATLGPLVGYLSVRKIADSKNNNRYNLKGLKSTLSVFGLLAMSMVVSGFIINGFNFSISKTSATYLVFAFVYFFLTSGTEEFGWRGVLYNSVLKRTKDLWDSSVVMGFLWGLWHTPIVLYIFVTAGLSFPFIIFSFVGFLASIVFMSYLHGWLYVRYQNPILNYVLHSLHNAFPVITIVLYSQNSNSLATIAGYLISIFILERFFNSKKFLRLD